MKVSPPSPGGCARGRAAHGSPPDQRSRQLADREGPADEAQHRGEEDADAGWAAFAPRDRSFIMWAACANVFLGQLGFGIFAPFFPQEAAAKGVSTSIVGLIFGIFQVVGVAFTPVTMLLQPMFGTTALLNCSLIICGVSNIIAGLAWYLEAGLPFTSAQFGTRIFSGIGVSMQMQLAYALLPCLFPDSVSFSVSILETVIGVALIAAPMVGSTLYLVAGGAEGLGYVAPLVALGIVQLLISAGMLLMFPSLPRGASSSGGMLSGFRGSSITVPQPCSPPPFGSAFPHHHWHKGPGSARGSVVLPVLIAITAAAGSEYQEPTLQPFLAEPPFCFSVFTVGLVFAVMAAVYALSGPIAGRVDDCFEGERAVPIMLGGLVVTGVGYVFLAPADWLRRWVPLEVCPLNAWLGAVLIGLGVAFSAVPCYGSLLAHGGHKEETERSNAAAAVFNIAWGLGAFLGPTLCGVASDRLGVPASYSGCGLALVALAAAFALAPAALGRPPAAGGAGSGELLKPLAG